MSTASCRSHCCNLSVQALLAILDSPLSKSGKLKVQTPMNMHEKVDKQYSRHHSRMGSIFVLSVIKLPCQTLYLKIVLCIRFACLQLLTVSTCCCLSHTTRGLSCSPCSVLPYTIACLAALPVSKLRAARLCPAGSLHPHSTQCADPGAPASTPAQNLQTLLRPHGAAAAEAEHQGHWWP